MIYTSLISVCGFSYGLAMKTALRLTIFIAVTTLTSGQDTLSCGTDNLSCPRSDPDSQSLQCIAVSQLCDGSSLCSGGQDEGDNLSTIDCTTEDFLCTTGESVPLSALCDGTADCSNGNDETSPICENKCRSPYKGGCAELNRECTYTELDVSCDDCISGFTEVVGSCVQGLTIGAEQPYYSISEDEGSLEVCVDILLGSISSNETYTISYTTINGAAEAPDDFLEQSGTLTLTPTATRQCISIPITDDSVNEADQECFTVSFTESSSSVDPNLSPAVATVCISDTDDDALRVGFEQTAYTVDEVDGFQLVCIGVLSGEADGREIVLDYSTSSGSATTSDYTASSGEVTISDVDTRQCVSIPIRRDSSTESQECFTFRISLSNTVNNLTVDPDEASICIVDMNAIPITIGLTRGLYYISESAGSLSICYEILSGRTATRSISMQFRTVEGEAEDGEDYTYTYTSNTLDDSDSSDCSAVPILSDSIDEEEECFTVSLSSSTYLTGLTINPRIGTVCITDDDPTPVTIGLQWTAYSVYETDEYQVVCAEVLSGDIAERSIEIEYITTSDTAEVADDFTAINGSFIMSDDAQIQCVPIAITSDSVAEPGQECFAFAISAVSSVAGLTLNPSGTEICISDAEEVVIPDLTVYWQESYYSASEADGSIEVCAELSTLEFVGNVQVDYATVGDSAEGSNDFTAKNGTLSFTNTSSTQCTSIIIVDDAVSESSDECFTVGLSDATETIANPNVATICISDDDAYSVTVGLQQTAYTITEVDGYQLVCLEVLSGNVEGRELVFDYTTSSGTANTGDYAARSGKVTITDDALLQCVSIQIRTDASTESTNECFTFRISSAATVDGLTVDPRETEICIVDRDSIPVTIGLRQSVYYVNENAVSVIVCYDLLSGRTATRSINIQFRTIPGEAKEGEDYTYTYTSNTLDDSDSSDCSAVPILSDSIDEEEECFTVSLSSTSYLAGLTINPRIGTVCINDDDPTPVTIGLQWTAYSVYETDEYQVVCAEVLSGDIAKQSIEIEYITTSDTAEASSDYTAQNDSFQLSSSALLQCTPIAIALDGIEELGQECFIFKIAAVSSVAGLTLSPSEAQICISDSEVIVVPEPTVRLKSNYYSVGEGDGSLEVCAEITTDQFDGNFQANYVTTSGSAEATEDFQNQSGMLTFTSDETELCFSIVIISDSVRESVPECFTISIVNATGDIAFPSVATACIIDDDVLSVRVGLQQTAYTVGEVDGYQLVCFEVLAGDIDGREIVINFSTASGTANTGDYTARSGEVTITEDVLFQCVSIQIRTDTYTEATNECFNFRISSAATVSGLTVEPSETKICIVDRDSIPITIGLRKSLYYVNENTGSVIVCYDVLSGRTASRSINMQFRTVQGDAKDGEDYTYTYTSDTLDDNDSSDCSAVPILSDSIDEEEECFTVSLSSSTYLAGLTINPRIGTICIYDEDPTHVGIGLDKSEYSVPDTAEYQVVCADVQSGSVAGRDIEIHYIVTDIVDSTVQNGTLLFTDDATIQCVAVRVTSDSPGSPDEELCFSLSLSATTTVSGLTLSPAVATVCVVPTEDIPLIIGLQQGYYSAGEDSSSVQVCVDVVSGEVAGRSISLNYTTLEGSAEAPGDYSHASGTILITDDDTTQCVNISIINDSEDEQDRECFAFAITTTTTEAISLETTQTTICISDDDVSQVMIGLQKTAYTVTEANTIVLVCTAVESGNIAGRTITIDYETTDDSAQAPSDYSSVSGNFDMTDTNRVQCIPITIVSDSITETPDECFTYTISTTSSAVGVTLYPTTATIRISDEEEISTLPTTIGLRQSYYSTVEGQGPVNICIALLSGDISGSTFTISYSTSDGSAEAPTDYAAQSGSFTISASSTLECISISIILDSLEEADMECFIVSFSSSSSDFTLKAPSVATVCISDAFTTTPVRIGLQQTQYSVRDTVDYQVMCAEVQSGSVAGRDINICYDVTDTADSSVQNGTLLFTDDAIIQCVAVSIPSDSLGSPDEGSCFSLSLSASNTVSGLTLSPALATVCVVPAGDADAPLTIGLQQGYYSAGEESGMIQVCVEVVSGNVAGRSISVNYTTIDGAAQGPDDFSHASGTFLITEDDTEQCVNISIINDSEDEQDRECFAFTISATSVEDFSLQTIQTTICISDDDATQVRIGLQQTVYRVTETTTTVLICMAVESGSIAGRSITIDYQTADGSAEAPSDYNSASGNFDMTDSNTVQCIPIAVISDNTTEPPDECFTFTTSTSSLAGLTLSPTAATVCISDEQTAVTIGLRQSFYSTVEGQGPVEVCIAILSGDITGSSVDIGYSATDGLAEAPTDYVAQSGLLTISDMSTSDCISVPIIADTLEEPDMECFIVSFSTISSDIVLAPSVATICINEGPRAILSLQPPIVIEGQTAQACLVLTRLDRLTKSVNITLSTLSASSTAITGADYVSASQDFVFDPSMTTTQVCMSILTLEDELVEDTETISIAATGISGLSLSGSPATLEIHSREFAFYQFMETMYAVRENVSSLQLVVELAPSSGTLLDDLTLSISTVGRSATALTDFQPLVSIPLAFPAGSEAGDTQRFTVEIIDDAIVEGSELFSLVITDSSLTAQPVSGQDSASIAIIDNDAEVNVGFASLQYTAEESTSEASLLEVCLKVFGPESLSQASLVRVQTLPGSAEASSDYASLDTVVVFPVGSSEGDRQCLNVTILSDDAIEGTEHFFLKVSSVETLSLIVIDPSAAQTIVSIADRAMVNFRIIYADSVSEDIGSVDVCVEQMNGELNEEMEIRVQTSPIGSTATASDYESTTFTLTFLPGVSGPRSMCNSLEIFDDRLVEEDEIISVTASFEQNTAEISLISNSASMIITDNDYVLYAWENPEYKVVEDSGSVAINLCLVSESGTLTFPVEVTVSSAAISATEDDDYVRVSQSLLMESGFAAGTCVPLTISIIKDGVLESDETFQLSASDASSRAMASSSNGGIAVLTIVDDDSACQQELVAARSNASDCRESSSSSSASAAQVGGGVVGGFVAGVSLTIVLAVVILLIIGWKCVPRKRSKMEILGQQDIEESSKM